MEKSEEQIVRETQIATDHKWIEAINQELEKRGIDMRMAYPKFPCQPVITWVLDALQQAQKKGL